MGTVPTGKLEKELRKLYLQWLAGMPEDPALVEDYINTFSTQSRDLIAKMGGDVARQGAMLGFPAPKLLELSPVADVVYDQMKQSAIQAGIMAGLSSKDVARQMFNAGMDKSYKRLERLARTETVSAYWKNQWDSAAHLPDIVMVWGSEESKRTCDYCLSRDGLVVEDGNIRDHPNGRCTLIPTHRLAVEYKGTLRADGSVWMDPKWTGKAERVKGTAGPTTADQRDPISSKRNPAAPSVAQPVHQPVNPRPARTGNPRADAIADIQHREGVTLAEAVQIYKTGNRGPSSDVTSKVVKAPVAKRPTSATTVSGDLAERQAVRETLAKLEAVAPSSTPKLNAVRVLSPEEMKLKGANAYYMHGANEIQMSKKGFTAAANASKRRDDKNGWFVPTGNASAAEKTLVHEFGHHIDEHLTPGKRSSVFNAIAEELGLPAPAGDYNSWVSRYSDRLGREVSRYGADNAQELLAEIWAESVLSPTPRPLAKRIGSLLRG